MLKINHIQAFELLDSRGHPTVATIVTVNDVKGEVAIVPSGASTGKKEALELRDNDPSRFQGKGVLKAVYNITQTIAPALINREFHSQQELDQALIELDSSPNKSNLGANAVLGVSLGFAKASAAAMNLPMWQYLTNNFQDPSITSCRPAFYKWAPVNNQIIMPIPFINVLNGGAHADNPLIVQEFMIVPHGATDFAHALQLSAEVFAALRARLKQQGFNTNVGDEGGFAPDMSDIIAVLDMLMGAINDAGLSRNEMGLALDIAASQFYENETYNFTSKKLTFSQFFPHLSAQSTLYHSGQMVDYYSELINRYPIISLEDPLAEDDWAGWQMLTNKIGDKVQLIGDDLFVTQCEYLKQGIDIGAANGILIKPNQVGTITEAAAAVKLGFSNNFTAMVSHRSGETEDTFIADLSVAFSCGQIKTGSLCRGERTAKYNRLLRIAANG